MGNTGSNSSVYRSKTKDSTTKSVPPTPKEIKQQKQEIQEQRKEVKQEFHELKAAAEERNLDQIKSLQSAILQQSASIASSDDNLHALQSNMQILQATCVANNQIQRGGDNFTKPDLIAIIMCIKRNQNLEALQSLTCSELRSVIRNQIYNVSHYMSTQPATVHNDIQFVGGGGSDRNSNTHSDDDDNLVVSTATALHSTQVPTKDDTYRNRSHNSAVALPMSTKNNINNKKTTTEQALVALSTSTNGPKISTLTAAQRSNLKSLFS
jgi:hypothetical protein